MKFRDLLSFIKEDELDFLATETNVDYQVKKLKGSILFKLILYTMVESRSSSLRVMETFFNSSRFRLLAKISKIETKYNSLSDRITNIDSSYFEKIFDMIFQRFNHHLGEQNSLQLYDTTMVALSSKLVDWGMRVGSKTNKVQLKYTVGMQGRLPCTFKVFNQPSDLCEDNTIPKVILEYKNNQAGIVVFDRGVQKRKTFVELSKQDILFVTRIKTNVNYKVLDILPFEQVEQNSVKVKEDLKIFFIQRGNRTPIERPFRLIKCVIKDSVDDLFLITNNFELTPYEIADIYKKRWEIEVFFRFVKQELSLKHMVNRSPNGIKVMMYMTLILSSLIIVYKKENNLKGYKIVKMKIANELYDSLLREIVQLTGGNPKILDDYFDNT